MIARRLMMGGGGSFIDPIALIRAYVSDITAADAYDYQVTESGGRVLDTIKVIDDGAGAYVGAFHALNAGTGKFEFRLATSTDLMTWTAGVMIANDAHSGTIGRRPGGTFLLAYENDVDPNSMVVREYSNLANLLAGSHSTTYNVPRTLAAAGAAEGTPNFYSTDEPLDIGFHYNDGTRDKEARGTLTDLSGTPSWVSAAATTFDDAISALGFASGSRGDRDNVTWRGVESVFVEAQSTVGDFSTFRIIYWSGTTASLNPITTHGGSTAQANITVSVVANPSGPGDVLFVGLFLHSDGAAVGEAGQAIYYRALP